MDRSELDAALRESEARAASRFRGRVFWILFLAVVAALAWLWRARAAQEDARERAATDAYLRQRVEIERWRAEIEAERAEADAAEGGR